MKVLVTAASKHGATGAIAEHIGRTLSERGLDIELAEPERVDTVEPYDAVVLASAVYAGNWRPEAMEFVSTHESGLRRRRVWLISSGPLGDEADPSELPKLDELMETTGAISHTWFAGKLDKDDLSLGERAIVRMVKAPYGDFREWDTIADWANDVADRLLPR